LEVWRLALLPDHKTLISGCKDGSVKVWHTGSLRRKQMRVAVPGAMVTAAFAPDSKSILTLDEQGNVARHQGTDFQQTQSLLQTSTNIIAARFSSDGRRLVTGLSDGRLEAWDLETRSLWRECSIASGPLYPLRFLAGNRTLFAYESGGPSFRQLDLDTCKELRSWPTQCGPVEVEPAVCEFSPDEKCAVEVGFTGGSWLRETSTGRELDPKLEQKQAVGAAFSPDGGLFAVACEFGFAKLWDWPNRKEIATFGGFLQGVHSLAFSPDSKRLAVGSDGKEAVKLWDIESQQELLTLEGQGSTFRFTIFSPDGNVIAGKNAVGLLQLWLAPSWAEIESAEGLPRQTH
jgi:WD40 repeat protein